MSSCITTAFETYLQACITAGTKVALDEIVLAYIPGLDHTATPPRTERLPAAADIVYRQAIDQSGKLGANSVAYSIVMDTHVGDFSFNAMYLINKASSTVAMIVYKQVETKIATNGATQGNSIIKTMVMEYSGAALATGITVNANTWQVDMSGQLQALQNQINNKSDVGHGHVIADVNGLQSALNGKSATGHGHAIADVSGLQAELNNKANSSHKHAIADVGGLQDALNGKSNSGHQHEISDILWLQDRLNGKANSSHSHNNVTAEKTVLFSGDVDGGDFVLSAPYSDFEKIMFVGCHDNNDLFTCKTYMKEELDILQETGVRYQIFAMSSSGNGWGWDGRFDSDNKTFKTVGQNSRVKAVFGFKSRVS